MRRLTIGFLAVLLTGIASPARAELVIYAQDTTLTPGGSGYLNVYLSGAPTDLFDTYQVTLTIGGGGAVTFAPADLTATYPLPNAAADGYQPFNYLYPPDWTSANPTTAPNYIFANASLDSAAQAFGGMNSAGYGANYFTISDDSLTSPQAPMSDAAPTLATASASTLLASLLIQATPGYTGQFSVGLSFTPGTPMGPADTYFQVGGSNLTDVSQTLGSSANFTGTISISSVPEPGSIVTGMTALLILAGFGRTRLARRSGTASA